MSRGGGRIPWWRIPAMGPRFVLALGAFLLIVLTPLSFIGDLRLHYRSYLLLASAATIGLYAGVYLLKRVNAEPSRRSILLVALLLRLAMLPMLPSLSDDVYRYLWDGRLVLHGVSPYLHTPADSALAPLHDELFRRQGYPTTNTIYPPGAQIIFAASMAPSHLLGADYMVGYYTFKLLLIAAEMIALWLLLELLAMRGGSLRAALLYAWHPLTVIELAGQGHTDLFWVLSLALALHAFATGRRGGGLPGLALGVSTRLYPLMLIPLWWRFLDRRSVLRGIILSLPFALLFIPLLDPAALESYTTVLARFTNYYEFNGGFYYGVKWLLDELHIKPSNVISGSIAAAAQLLVILAVWLWPVRDRSMRTLAQRALLIITAQIVLGAKVHVWYFVAPLFLLTLIGEHPLRRAWLWVALVAPFTYLIYASDPPAERFDVVAIEWGGFLLIALFDLWRARYGEKPSTSSREMDGSR